MNGMDPNQIRDLYQRNGRRQAAIAQQMVGLDPNSSKYRRLDRDKARIAAEMYRQELAWTRAGGGAL